MLKESGGGFYRMTVSGCVQAYNMGLVSTKGLVFFCLAAYIKPGLSINGFDLQDSLTDAVGSMYLGLTEPLSKRAFERARKELINEGLIEYDKRTKKIRIVPPVYTEMESEQTKRRGQAGRMAKAYKDFKDLCDSLTDKKCEELESMPYDDFLSSPYWATIRQYKLATSNYQCQECGAIGKLHTHHKTYTNHGWEHCNLEDLIVLCPDCHAKAHGKTA